MDWCTRRWMNRHGRSWTICKGLPNPWIGDGHAFRGHSPRSSVHVHALEVMICTNEDAHRRPVFFSAHTSSTLIFDPEYSCFAFASSSTYVFFVPNVESKRRICPNRPAPGGPRCRLPVSTANLRLLRLASAYERAETYGLRRALAECLHRLVTAHRYKIVPLRHIFQTDTVFGCLRTIVYPMWSFAADGRFAHNFMGPRYS